MRLSFLALIIFLSFKVQAKVKNQKLYYLKQKYDGLDYGLTFWQEGFDVSNSNGTDKLEMRFEGLHVGLKKNQPLKGLKWLRVYGYEGKLGYASGATVNQDSDRLKNQMFAFIQAHYGYAYRTSLQSSIAFGVPLSIKHVFWNLEEDLDIKNQVVSLGVMGEFHYRLGFKSEMVLRMNHQFLWSSTIWTLMYTKELR